MAADSGVYYSRNDPCRAHLANIITALKWELPGSRSPGGCLVEGWDMPVLTQLLNF